MNRGLPRHLKVMFLPSGMSPSFTSILAKATSHHIAVGHPVGCRLARLCGGRLHGGAAVVAEVGHVHVAGVDGAHRGLNSKP